MSSRSPARDLLCELWSAGDDGEVVNYYFRFLFRTVSRESKAHFVPRAAKDNILQLRRNLLNLGAVRLPDKVGFSKLLNAADRAGPKGHLVHRPGWHAGSFIGFEGKREVTIGSELLACEHSPLGLDAYLGHTSGRLKDWQDQVAAPALSSAIISYAIMCAFAAPLARYAGLAEGAIFCISGPSSTGKTTALKVAASVSGDPDLIGDFNLTPTGAEEFAYAHSDHLMLIDDTERTGGDVTKLVSLLTHVLTGGQGKKRSRVVHDMLPPLSWFSFGLVTSPEPLASVTQNRRTGGQQVRLIEIPVPEGDDGVFDDLEEGQTGASLSQELSQAVRDQHGTAFEDWQERLPQFKKGVRGGLEWLVDYYIEKKKLDVSGPERRALEKLLLPVWAAYYASKAGILPWNLRDINSITKAIIPSALDVLRTGGGGTKKAWQDLATATSERARVFDMRKGLLPRPLRARPGKDHDIGVIDETDGQLEIGLTSGVIDHMKKQGDKALAGATPDQPEQRRLQVKNGNAVRPRLYWVPAEKFAELVQLNAGEGYKNWGIDE